MFLFHNSCILDFLLFARLDLMEVHTINIWIMQHNFTDGMALGSAFLLHGSVGGWSRTLFLLAHELPQEVRFLHKLTAVSNLSYSISLLLHPSIPSVTSLQYYAVSVQVCIIRHWFYSLRSHACGVNLIAWYSYVLRSWDIPRLYPSASRSRR
jgi:hypothetical protein